MDPVTSFISWILIGTIIGLLANGIPHKSGVRPHVLAHVVIGIVGALIGAYLFASMGGAPGNLSLMVSAIGATVFELGFRFAF